MPKRAEDLTGRLFGSWNVQKRASDSVHGHAMWTCRCTCGVEKDVLGSNLRQGLSVRCRACASSLVQKDGRGGEADLTGSVFTRLTVLRLDLPDKGPGLWVCECSCEAKTIVSVTAARLRNGDTKSCGCLKRDVHARRIAEIKQLAFYESLFTPEPHPSIGTFMDLV